ncbi:hypothetical protein [Thiocapsa bogorovii]|uniref:hypothetical protein n=1 Tax=Thiocapsa bogorovii TaxID=521689 RepID=UPI0022B62B40|nr:hypothetical protein [Thiocapsa bogorovii]
MVTPNGEGAVIDVGLCSTKIRTFDDAVIFRRCAVVEANGLSIAFPSQTLSLRQKGG